MNITTRHDPALKGLFKCPPMFLSLLRSGVGTFRLPEEWLERIDPDSMRVELSESHTRAHGERRSDLVVSFRLREPKGRRGGRRRRSHQRASRLFFHLEFQSEPDPHMHWRFEEYIHGVRSQVARHERDSRAFLISALVYTGKRKWNPRTHTVPPDSPFSVEEVARVTGTVLHHYAVDFHRCRIDDLSKDEPLTWLICLEQANSKKRLWEVLEGTGHLFIQMGEEGEHLMDLFLRRAREIHRGYIKGVNLPNLVRIWRKGEQNMGTLAQTHADRWLARRDARRDAGRDAKTRRELLCRQAKLRFGDATAGRLEALIKRINDSDRLNQIADWFVVSKSGEEFLARVESGHSLDGAPALDAAD